MGLVSGRTAPRKAGGRSPSPWIAGAERRGSEGGDRGDGAVLPNPDLASGGPDPGDGLGGKISGVHSPELSVPVGESDLCGGKPFDFPLQFFVGNECAKRNQGSQDKQGYFGQWPFMACPCRQQ